MNIWNIPIYVTRMTILTDLKILHCQHTLVSSLPVGLHQLSLLEELHAHHCRLQTIDGRLGLLPHLHVINCTSNPIWSPSSEALDLDCANLKRVLSGLVLTQQPHAVSSHIMSVSAPHDPCACSSKNFTALSGTETESASC